MVNEWHGMKPISDLFGNKSKPQPRTRRTERGDLLEYLCSVINPSRIETGYNPISIKRMAFLLQKIPTKDLYYMKSIALDKQRTGGNFSKWFWWSLKPKQEHKDITTSD